MAWVQDNYAIELWAFASPIYWPDQAVLTEHLTRCELSIRQALGTTATNCIRVRLVTSEHEARQLLKDRQAGTDVHAAIIMAMSGGVQPWILAAAEQPGSPRVALMNAYLPEFFELAVTDSQCLADPIMHRNAHPATTDSFAHLRLAGHQPIWLSHLDDMKSFVIAARATSRMRNARLLMVGQTEPWVINSTRDLLVFKNRLGLTVIPIPQEELVERFELVPVEAAIEAATDWLERASMIVGIDQPADEIVRACRLAITLKSMISEHHADGSAIACFNLIGKLNTTSCLAVSMLNDTEGLIGGCEGDLDAAATLLLLKAMDCDFVWVANPVIRDSDRVDLVHCTAPRCACGMQRPYRLLRHHESGRGVSPEVKLPDDGRDVTLVRIGNQLTELVAHSGTTEPRGMADKLRACHTQLRVRIESSQRMIQSLLGTHFVVTYGDRIRPLRYAADLMGLRMTETVLRRS